MYVSVYFFKVVTDLKKLMELTRMEMRSAMMRKTVKTTAASPLSVVSPGWNEEEALVMLLKLLLLLLLLNAPLDIAFSKLIFLSIYLSIYLITLFNNDDNDDDDCLFWLFSFFSFCVFLFDLCISLSVHSFFRILWEK